MPEEEEEKKDLPEDFDEKLAKEILQVQKYFNKVMGDHHTASHLTQIYYRQKSTGDE